MPLVGEPQESRAEHLLQLLAREMTLHQPQDPQREVDGGPRKGGPAAPMARASGLAGCGRMSFFICMLILLPGFT